MRTVFSPERFEYTKKAHLAARKQFYSLMWPDGVEFEDTTQTARDLDYAIDCQLAVTVDGLRAPIRLSVQERFRNPKDQHYGDVTVTEWNLASGQPSELHKLAAQLFVYGFYDEPADRILLAAAIDVGLMQWAFTHGDLTYERRNRGDQSFVGFPIAALQKIGAVLFFHDARCAVSPAPTNDEMTWPPVRQPGTPQPKAAT